MEKLVQDYHIFKQERFQTIKIKEEEALTKMIKKMNRQLEKDSS